MESTSSDWAPASQDLISPSKEDHLTTDEQGVLWGLVLFTCMFQTLHRISLKATTWLLKLLSSLLVLLGKYSPRIARIAQAFPATIYKRTKFVEEELQLPSVKQYVVCKQCLNLFDYCNSFEKHGSRFVIKLCVCQSRQPLLKRVISSQNVYPYMVYFFNIKLKVIIFSLWFFERM